MTMYLTWDHEGWYLWRSKPTWWKDREVWAERHNVISNGMQLPMPCKRPKVPTLYMVRLGAMVNMKEIKKP